MNPTLEGVSRETLDAAIAAKSTSGLLVSTGIQGVDLSGLTSLVPVNVPARNNTSAFPRKIAGEGSQTATWRTLLNVNSSQSNPAVGMDFAGVLALLSEQDCFAPYRPLAEAGRVTLDAVAVSRGFADALAVAELQTLIQLFIGQDIHIINSQAWGLGTTATPTASTATTGGSLPATTQYDIAVAARSGFNYYYGGSAQVSAKASPTTGSGSTNTITGTIPAQQGAVAYDWYFGTHGGTMFYYTTTTVASCTFTTAIAANQAVPALPLISSTAPTFAGAATDGSFSTNNYNGVLASSLGDYGTTGPVKPGSGTSSGVTFLDNGGAAPVLSGGGIDVLDKLNDSLWASVQLSPTAYMVNSLQGDEISKLILGSSSATTFLPPTDSDARTNLAAGGFIGRYVNRAAGGVPVPIEVHPHLAPGTIIARTDRVPFPGSNIGSVFEVRCQYDTQRFDYSANYQANTSGGGPRFDFEIRSMETLVNRAPVAQAVASNIG